MQSFDVHLERKVPDHFDVARGFSFAVQRGSFTAVIPACWRDFYGTAVEDLRYRGRIFTVPW